MKIGRILRGFVARYLRHLVTSGERYQRHGYTLHRASITPEQIKVQQHQTWWGNESRWYPGGTPPRIHNRLTPLIDGENFFQALQEALSKAKDYVFISGWSFTPYIPLERENYDKLIASRLLVLLNQVAEHACVRILLWNGAPFLFQPNTDQTKQILALLKSEGRGDLKCYLDKSAPLTHCHHQKAIVIDGQVAFVGGIDLTTFLGDRYDTQTHPLRAGLNWHDVQLKIEGEAVADVEHNFRQRWDATLSRQKVNAQDKGKDKILPKREPYFEQSWSTPVQIVRTIPRHIYKCVPRGEFGIFHAYTSLIAQAERFIYLENQYLWSPHILDALRTAINKPRSQPLRIVIVLPAKAEDGKWDNDKHVQKLQELDQGKGFISVYSLYTSGPNLGEHPFTYRGIYVHSKVSIVDDEWFMVGSANLNNRGLITDSEIGAIVHDPELACKLRVALWAEHLGLSLEEVARTDPCTLIDHEWPSRATSNQNILKEKNLPLPCAVYPYQLGYMPGGWFLEEAEALTFEH